MWHRNGFFMGHEGEEAGWAEMGFISRGCRPSLHPPSRPSLIHHLQWGKHAGLNKGRQAGFSFPLPLLELEGSRGS